MSGPQRSRRAGEQGGRGAGAASSTGPLLLCSCALLFFALLRGSINNAWDAWDTVTAAAGGLGLLGWGFASRAMLRRRARARGVRYGSQALLSSLLLLAALGLVNFVAQRHNRSWDLTEGGLFTLSSETTQVLRSLPRDVRLLAFFPTGRRGQAADLLRRYAEAAPHLSYEFVDLDQDPERAARYEVTKYGTVILEVPHARGLPDVSGKPVRVEAEETGATSSARSYLLSEEKLTNALLKVVRGSTKTIYFLEGHGEADTASPELNGYARVRNVLEAQAFVVKPLFLGRNPQVPADCAVLVVAGPGQEPAAHELAAVERYLEAGGKAIFLVDPSPGAGLEKFLDRWGVRVGRDLVIDASGGGRLYGTGPALPVVKDYDGRHPITRNFRLTTLFPLARSLTPSENPGDAQVWPLAQTSPDSFGEPYDGGRRRFRFDPAHDRKGPLLLAVAVTRAAKEGKEARLVVTGSSNFITNAFFDKTAGNGDFFLNCVNWAAQEDALIALRPRPRQDRRVELTEGQGRGIFWLVVIGMPLVALALGVVVQVRRRLEAGGGA